uniref:Uncharacterized protein n=1 Tax=Anguilla anguilla TaxID=7936 RepID=A0A0E9TXS9_ANGAN
MYYSLVSPRLQIQLPKSNDKFRPGFIKDLVLKH